VTSSTTESAALTDVTMPQMGVSVAEGTIVAWRVAVGDRIGADETICDISTDKIDTEVPSPAAGTVAEILVDVGATVPVGTVLARLSTDAATPSEPPGEAPAAPAPPSGETPAAPPPPAARPATNGRRYSPVVSRIAAEHGIDLSSVTGTGRNGRVRKQDVLALVDGGAGAVEPPLHIESPYRPEPAPAPAVPSPTPGAASPTPGAASPTPGAASRTPGAPSPSLTPDGGGLSRMRRQIGERMRQSLQTAATCTTWAEVDMSRVEAARTRLGVTALAFVARATIDALREHPALNAWLNGEDYARVSDVNLGIAVSLGEDGLIVPVIHRAHELSVEGLAARIKDVAHRARSRELTADDVLGGTFTITNPGQYGSIMATPIINQPQVAILDLEAIVKRPVVISAGDGTDNDSIAIRPMTILGLSWDHRALDGALAAQFLGTVRRRLESGVT
jgi:pyruvate/2-oxoglutarate dehydrogenase complex dihydrolipoamide acyltransferase (E2) component